MEVWYQSPYPDDAARLPKLYLCEFCLQYQKCEIGMKRHAAKCVWRHPPGDEVNDISVTVETELLNSIEIFKLSDLSERKTGRLAGGWQTPKAILSTLVFAGEILSRSQDVVL